MKAGEVVFQKLLDGNLQYIVPLYQRTYSWDESQWEQLWDDLLEVYAADLNRTHFIGSVVTQQITTPPEHLSRYILIDGQQRMTTLFTLLSVIRKTAAARGEAQDTLLAQEIQYTCLTNQFKEGRDKNKLLPTQSDRASFQAVMDGETPPLDSQIGRAVRYFEDVLAGEDATGQPIDLRRMHGCIVNRLDMVSIHLEKHDSPNRIFESLNNTGMRLSVSDLIRNYLLMTISDPHRQELAYTNLWFPMERRLSQNWSSSDDFFWRFLMMDGSLPRKDDTFDGVRARLKNEETPEKAEAELGEYSKLSRYYAQLIELDSEESDLPQFIVEQIKRLNRWEVRVAYPFLMQGMDKMETGRISERELGEVMRMIESFVIRRVVCGVPTNLLRRFFAQMSAEVQHDDFVQKTRDLLLRNRWPSDEQFQTALVTYDLYVPARLERTRLILESLQDSFLDVEPPKLTDGITIEHIMPQVLSESWLRDLGVSATETHEWWLNTVGNLTLTGRNSTLGNKSFADKKKWFKKSNFALSQGILEVDAWNATTIEERGRALAERAVKIWPRQ